MGSLYERTVPVEARLLHEGVFDPHILKAIFTGGGMGAGKSAVAGWMFGKSGSSFGLKSLSVDEIFEMRAAKMGLSTKSAFHEPTEDPKFASKGHEVHYAAWYTMMKRRAAFGGGRLGVLIDGTAKDPAYILRGKKSLEALGYDCSMVMVTTPLAIAQERNRARGRVVTDADLRTSHDATRKAASTYKRRFGARYYEIENAGAYDVGSREFRAEIEPQFHRLAMKILGKPITNPKGKAWVTQQLEGAPAHLKKKVWQGLGIRWKPSAVDKLGELGRRALKTTR
jgi:hypothetical protein